MEAVCTGAQYREAGTLWDGMKCLDREVAATAPDDASDPVRPTIEHAGVYPNPLQLTG